MIPFGLASFLLGFFMAWVGMLPRISNGWTVPSAARGKAAHFTLQRHSTSISGLFSTSTEADPSLAQEEEEKEEEEDDEFEYVEYDSLSEADFVNSEWIVGSNLKEKRDTIEETWVRLITTEKGKNVAIWGDNSKGTWSLDRVSQYFSISKEYLWGKGIWAGIVDDYYYLQGTIRGWTLTESASVWGQWQSRRLGVEPEEAGIAPWFQDEAIEGKEDSAGEDSVGEVGSVGDESAEENSSNGDSGEEESGVPPLES